jgi:hypothetical protein
MRILQGRSAAGSVQTRSSPHSYRRQRVRFLLRKMRPNIPTEKEKVGQAFKKLPLFFLFVMVREFRIFIRQTEKGRIG